MSINSSGSRLERFFTGKGFYIVLFLCAAVIGLSAWMMAAGNETMENLSEKNSIGFESSRIETIIIPPQSETEDMLPVSLPETEAVIADDEAAQVWSGNSAESAGYVWPVLGELERSHDIENLDYDVTLKDWRTHDGVDIAAPLGTAVSACGDGTVLSVEEDGLYGTVVTVDHGDGLVSSYANLDEFTNVIAGESIMAGDIIGSVGSSALCEAGQNSHLHFAMACGGMSVDPMDYLPS